MSSPTSTRPTLSINVLSPLRLSNKDEGRLILDFLVRLYPEFVPQKYSYYEPIKLNFDPSNIDQALSGWGRTFLWKRIKPKIDGCLFASHRPPHDHGWIIINVEIDSVVQARLTQFLKDISELLGAHFASLHLLTRAEADKTRGNDSIGGSIQRNDPPRLLVTSHILRKYVPNLYWATVFGEPYVNLIGRDQLLSSPAFAVEELGYGAVCVQLSKDIYDFETNYVTVNSVREAVKEHFEYNLFFEPEAFEDQVYDVPEFDLDADKPKP